MYVHLREWRWNTLKRNNNHKLLQQFTAHNVLKSTFSTQLLTCFELFDFSKGDHVITQGIISDYLFFIVEGQVRIYHTSNSGNLTLLSFSKYYSALGDSASLFNQEAYATVEALTDGKCIGISLIKYRHALLEDPKFLRKTCESLASKLNETNATFADIFLESIENRLAYYILNTSHDQLFSANLTECALLLRTSYRHLLRVLNTFCENGVLIKCGKHYQIKDEPLLKKLSYQASNQKNSKEV